MQDYSKLLTERGMLPRFFGQAPSWDAAGLLRDPEGNLRTQSSTSRFSQPHAWLFPFLGRKVRTPAGPGTLQQVFADRVTVLLDSELSKCASFTPNEVAPCDWSI
jgi:hypothetical protein